MEKRAGEEERKEETAQSQVLCTTDQGADTQDQEETQVSGQGDPGGLRGMTLRPHRIDARARGVDSGHFRKPFLLI